MVTVYTTQTCSYCVMVKKYLTMKGISFNAVDITDDMETRQKLLDKTGMQTVPVTTDGEDYIVGWNPGQLTKFLDNLKPQAV
jgi:glutaredoxin 3